MLSIPEQFHAYTSSLNYQNNQEGFEQEDSGDLWFFAHKQISPELIIRLNLIIHIDTSYSIILENFIKDVSKEDDHQWESHSKKLEVPLHVPKIHTLESLLNKWQHQLEI